MSQSKINGINQNTLVKSYCEAQISLMKFLLLEFHRIEKTEMSYTNDLTSYCLGLINNILSQNSPRFWDWLHGRWRVLALLVLQRRRCTMGKTKCAKMIDWSCY